MRARRAALDVLAAVRRRDAYANLVLPGVLRSRGLTGSEAARATDLAYGTLRGLGTFDRVIEACSSRSARRIDAETLDVLRLGTYQVLATRTPVHAAVSTSVVISWLALMASVWRSCSLYSRTSLGLMGMYADSTVT